MKTGIELIAEERARQIAKEGFTLFHDDQHDHGELGLAGIAYYCAEVRGFTTPGDPPKYWPFHKSWWKPDGELRNNIRAGALIRAERERLERLEAEIASEIDRLQRVKGAT